uniref:Uncharacterized protein n=1 Tax=Candidatus Kentrum sp. TUN TaxID=2126343 RepID=A0A450ZIN5_9GAMM|nr:MAG: hypothetical protein BECKTUN1418D_GA0071000_101814 [Candidatus Kentron sp. TUN]
MIALIIIKSQLHLFYLKLFYGKIKNYKGNNYVIYRKNNRKTI